MSETPPKTSPKTVLITIWQGQLRGLEAKDRNGSPFYSFRGIPYAKPPINELRFKAPVAPTQWEGIFDATTNKNQRCKPSFCSEYNYTVMGNEDCLNLNVYTKQLPCGDANKLKPVMLWIYGGDNQIPSDYTGLYGPEFLITEDVVLVVINYRLGILGFLSLDDPALGVPGNAGMKDMVMALMWVKKNIEHFNGNPKNVTIFGGSVGGTAVSLLILSPMTKGLIHKAIAQSGAALIPRALGSKCAGEIAAIIDVDRTDEKKVLDYLCNSSLDEINRIQGKLKDNQTASCPKPIGPVVERYGDNPFLSAEPIDIILNGTFNQVPFMAGYTTQEGLCFKNSYTIPDSLNNFDEHIPFLLKINKDSKESLALADKIKKIYYGDEKPSMENIEKKINIVTDNMFMFGICTTVAKMAEASSIPVYLYRMSLETSLNHAKRKTEVKVPGASHWDDQFYLFENELPSSPIQPGSVEDIGVRRFVKLWTNFAKTGDPTYTHDNPLFDILTLPKWSPVQKNQLHYLDIGEELLPGTNPDQKRFNFWKDIYASSPFGAKYV